MNIYEENYQLGWDAAEKWIRAGVTPSHDVCAFRTAAFANGFWDHIAQARKALAQGDN